MQNDKTSLVIRNDTTILSFGERLYGKCRDNPHQYNYVRQKMREIARFLMIIRTTVSNITHLKDCFRPAYFSKVLDSVKQTAGYNEETNSYDTPSLALKIGHTLKKCANIVKVKALEEINESTRNETMKFLEMMESEWSISISTHALNTLHKRKFNNPKRLPLSADLKLLNTYLDNKGRDAFETLKNEPDTSSWRSLAEVVLAQLILFNRRRAGEAERIEVSQYVQGLKVGGEIQEEIYTSLSKFEKKLVETLNRVEIRGKRGRRVPILFTNNQKTRIDLLIKTRRECEIDPKNIYIFARCGQSTTPIRSSDILRKFSKDCGAKNPEFLTSTALRKHVATVSQILSLKDNEMDALAGFLGHDIRVHREFYRLPESTIQVAKVSKILLAMEKGALGECKGKSLDEIDINIDDEIEAEAEDDDEEEYEHIDMEIQPSRRMWSNEEIQAVRRQLGKFLVLLTLPGKLACETAQNEPVLRSRPWNQIKYYIKNHKQN